MATEAETIVEPHAEVGGMDDAALKDVSDAASLGNNTKEETGNINVQEIARTNSEDREASPAISEGSVDEINALLTEAIISGSTATAKSKEGGTKSKRKEDKGIGKEELKHVLKALNSLETTEEKLAALCKKYTELLEEHRLLQNKSKQSQKKLQTISREKDQLQTEQSKTVLAKSKLESLCRELQRHNKLIKDESVARAKEEEEKRKEVTAKFQTTINDIQRQMNENYEKNNKLREENMELASKLKNLIEQYELREQHIDKVFKHKELEQQLVDAKLAQSNLMMTEEKERNIKERHQLLEETAQYQKKIELLEAQEAQLRSQVALYTEKYEEFQTTLAKSNEVFQSFKSEMDKMTKKIKKLEKETTMWRSRWENSNKALLEMAEDKTRSDKDILTLNSKVQKLESLCRALQEERKKLSTKVKNTAAVAAVNGSISNDKEENKVIEPTKTPPNTPEGGSRGSPVTVEGNGPQIPNLEANLQEETTHQTDQSESNSQSDSVTDKSEPVLQTDSKSSQSEEAAQGEETESQSEGSQDNSNDIDVDESGEK